MRGTCTKIWKFNGRNGVGGGLGGGRRGLVLRLSVSLQACISLDFLEIVLDFEFVCFSGHLMVQVNAQVMTRDENKGGWVPLGRGGVSRVCLLRHSLPVSPDDVDTLTKYEYHILGVLDQCVSINFLLETSIILTDRQVPEVLM